MGKVAVLRPVARPPRRRSPPCAFAAAPPQPLRLEIKKKLQARSDRVKCVDMHPTESWVLSALYNGKVFLWDFEAGTMVKSFDICDLPVRSAKVHESCKRGERPCLAAVS